MAGILYFLGLECLFTHELDAVTHGEWRLMAVLRSLPDEAASPWFVALHVPLFFAILWLSAYPRDALRETTRLVVAAFLVVHACLHLWNASDPLYGFHGALSQALIFSAAVFGAGYLLVRWRGSRSTGSGASEA